MMKGRKQRLVGYQNECNVRGLITANEISHAYKPEPCLNTHPPRTSIYDAQPLELRMRNPVIFHDTYITSNKVFHGPKYWECEFEQPQHYLPASLRRVDYIKPDFHRKIAQGDFNPNPVYHLSETHEEFRAKHRIHDIYGPPRLHITHRDVYLPIRADAVFGFDPDVPYSVLRMSHPYLTTSRMTHRGFSPEEIRRYKQDTKVKGTGLVRSNYRMVEDIVVGPMEDPLEPRFEPHVSLDYLKDYPSATGNDAGRKLFFRRHLYKGCPPRVFPPVELYGMTTTNQDTYSHPYSAQDKNNFTSPFKAYYIQPKLTNAEASVPFMYSTENEGYGSGNNVARQVKVSDPDICGSVCVP